MRFTFFLTALLISACLRGQGTGDSLFGVGGVHSVYIDFAQLGWWDTLTANKALGDQTGQDIYIPAIVTLDGRVMDSVGVRLKGNASYVGHPGTKKPLKLKFNAYINGQKFDGLKSVHLNNSAYDPTMLREKLMLDVLRRHGLPAPRCTYAAVYFNQEYVGLYKMIESIDKTFLQQTFGDNEGNLYKGDPNGTLQWFGAAPQTYYNAYELTTNETANDWTGLVDLIDRINNSGDQFPTRIRERLDVNAYLWTLAANNVFVNLDSYLFNPHNYYLYDDSTSGKFEWISWDVGLAFGVFPLWGQAASQELDLFYMPNPPDRVPLNKNLFAFDEFRQTYLEAICTYLNEDFRPSVMYAQIDSLADVIRPYVYAEPQSNQMYSNTQFEGNLGFTSYNGWILSKIPGLKTFIGERYHQLREQLCASGLACMQNNAVSPLGEESIHVYPVPSSSRVTVYFDSPTHDAYVLYQITDMRGRLVVEEQVKLDWGIYKRELDFSGQPAGVYVLRVLNSCTDIQKKIIIVH